MGDWNADPMGGQAWSILNDFMLRNGYICFDKEELSNDSFTFISRGFNYVKWLDHIIGNKTGRCSVNSIKILDYMVGSDHLPITCNILVPIVNTKISLNPYLEPINNIYVNWSKLSAEDLEYVSNRAYEILSLNNLYNGTAFSCINNNCEKKECHDCIDKFYNCIQTAVSQSSLCFSERKTKANKFRIIPGWNRNVKKLYKKYRSLYVDWIKNGGDRSKISYEEMMVSKTLFKSALKACKANKTTEEFLSIQEKMIVGT